MLRNIFIILILLLVSLTGNSQGRLSTKNKKAIEWFTEADNYRVRGHYDQAVELLGQALKKDEDFYEAWVRLGQTFKMAREYEKAAQAFEQARIHNPLNKPLENVYFELGEIHLGLGDYERAQEFLNKFLAENPLDKRRVAAAKRMLSNADFATENIRKAAELEINPLPQAVNAFVMQYFPVLTADKKTIIYTRRLGTEPMHDEDLVVSKKDEEGEWQLPKSLSANINSGLNEGTCTISADGRTLIFTSCYGRESVGNCDLYITYKEGDEWSVPKNIGRQINSPQWDSQPSLSADGRTLFFVSNRPGGYGEVDIYFSKLGPDQKWSKPMNAGKVLNTPGNEVSPFLHANNRTLFFSSDNHTGFGGYDIYKSEWDGLTEFNEPENIGSPINTSEDQVSIFITADGEDGYYSHENYTGNQRKSLIYTFKVPESFRPQIITNYVTGKITDKNTGSNLHASIELYDVNKNELVNLVYSDSISGEYLMVLPEGSKYALYVNKTGYLFESKSFDYKEKQEFDPVLIDFQLQPLNKGATTILNNIFFDFDSYEIRDESFTELRKVQKFLKANPKVRIEISGHTDTKGTDEYNLQLSKQRAKSVYEYLLKNEIPESQITYKGYGSKKPLVPNDSEEHMAMNRRIEFTIID